MPVNSNQIPINTNGKTLVSVALDTVFPDSEYESALSRPSIPLEWDAVGNPELATGGQVSKKKKRRDTRLPFFRFSQTNVNEDVERIEDDVNQLLHLGEAIKEEVEVLKRDAHPEQSKPATQATSTSPDKPHHGLTVQIPNSSHHKRVPKISSSPPAIDSLSEERNEDIQRTQDPNLQTLQQSLHTIRTHLTNLESAINENIAKQLLTLSDSKIPVLHTKSLPSFKTKKPQSSEAVLSTVKVACAVERGLEALVVVMEVGEERGKDGEKGEGGLIEACVNKPEEVTAEMHRAVAGMRRVLKTKRKKN